MADASGLLPNPIDRSVPNVSEHRGRPHWLSGVTVPFVDRLLVLWDIDHTLIENSGLSKETYAAAYELLTGEVAEEPAATDGRTDLAIMQRMFETGGHAWVDNQLWAQMVGHALQTREPQLRARGFALPGAREALGAIAGQAGVAQSVLTGNIRANAELKLRAFDLDQFMDFEIGAYGADGQDRADLVGVARRRAERRLGAEVPPESVVLIGDTPRDIAAARSSGARAVATATGLFDGDVLREAGADVVLDDLQDSGAVLEAVVGLAGVPSRALVEHMLGPVGTRWAHVQAVASRTRDLSGAVPPEDRMLLEQAALVHDIGYAEEVASTGLHALDGARWLRERGAPARLCALVARHTGAIVEAAERGLAEQLSSEFDDEGSATADALTCADLTTSPTGRCVTVDERLAEILNRYPPDSVVHRSVCEATPLLVAAVERTMARLATV